MNKTYLGDAVYAEEDDLSGDIVLTTENGTETTNRIVLEFEVFTALLHWAGAFMTANLEVDKATTTTG